MLDLQSGVFLGLLAIGGVAIPLAHHTIGAIVAEYLKLVCRKFFGENGSKLHIRIDSLQFEIVELKDRLTIADAEIEILRAENERLRADLVKRVSEHASINALRLDNARLVSELTRVQAERQTILVGLEQLSAKAGRKG